MIRDSGPWARRNVKACLYCIIARMREGKERERKHNPFALSQFAYIITPPPSLMRS